MLCFHPWKQHFLPINLSTTEGHVCLSVHLLDTDFSVSCQQLDQGQVSVCMCVGGGGILQTVLIKGRTFKGPIEAPL